jgi:hypothetical protein
MCVTIAEGICLKRPWVVVHFELQVLCALGEILGVLGGLRSLTAKNATLRAARPDSSLREERLLGMTSKLQH